MQNTNWTLCRIVCCSIAAVIGLIAILAIHNAIGVVAAVLIGIALGVILYFVLTRLVCGDETAAAPMASPSTPQEPQERPQPAATPEPAAPAAKPAPAVPASGNGQRPEGLAQAREGGPDDLKQIKGVGPKLEQLLNSMGYFHFDQIAAWTSEEVAWVDKNLKGFKGRVSRDGWVEQAKTLAAGRQTEVSKRVEDGDVY